MMNPGVAIPLAFFAAIVILVALVHFVRIHDLEVDTHLRIHQNEIEHRKAIERLDEELRGLRAARRP